jgi:flagellar basal-body rod modification protein FlgD
MSQVNGATNLLANTSSTPKVQSLEDLNADDFLKFLIVQLQQQDPLDPVKNQELLDQVNSIRDLAATTKLSTTLDSVLVGQNLATAGGLIGKNIKAITDKGDDVSGEVTSVTVASDAANKDKRDIRVHVGDKEVSLTNIREIVP